MLVRRICDCFFFFNDTATPEIYTLSLHDALPICGAGILVPPGDIDALHTGLTQLASDAELRARLGHAARERAQRFDVFARSEEHTSELQSRQYLVCRLLLEKKNKVMPKVAM